MKINNFLSAVGGNVLASQLIYAGVGDADPGNDMTIWIALFGLAVIGIFALYLSSDKVRHLTRQFTEMQVAQKEIETRQNILLSVIGDRLENSTLGIRRHREVFEGQSRETLDWEMISREMTRFRRDESLLLDAMHDLQDFSQIRLEKLRLENKPFDLSDMLKSLSRKVEPHYLLKRNELVYRLVTAGIVVVEGDMRRIEQVLSTFLVELGQSLYDATVILSTEIDISKKRLIFDLKVPEGDTTVQMQEDIFSDWDEADISYRSARKLKSHIAYELIRLMRGNIGSVSGSEMGTHYRIMLPLSAEVQSKPLELPDRPVLIISHNEQTALSINDILASYMSQIKIIYGLSAEEERQDMDGFETVVITYSALENVWAARLHSWQLKYPLRVIVLKNSFEKNLPTPEGVDVAQILRLPLLPEKLAEAMTKEPTGDYQNTVAVS